MAVNSSRSQNEGLREGATDGKYRYVCHDGPVFDAEMIYEPPVEAAS